MGAERVKKRCRLASLAVEPASGRHPAEGRRTCDPGRGCRRLADRWRRRIPARLVKLGRCPAKKTVAAPVPDPYQSLTTSSRRGLDSPRKLSIFVAVSLRRSVGDGPSPATFFTLAFDLYRASHNLYRACLACWPHASPYLAAWWSLSLDSARPLSIISCWVQICASSQVLQCLEVLFQLRSSFRR